MNLYESPRLWLGDESHLFDWWWGGGGGNESGYYFSLDNQPCLALEDETHWE